MAHVSADGALDATVVVLLGAHDMHGSGRPHGLGELFLAVVELGNAGLDDQIAHLRSAAEGGRFLLHVGREVRAALQQSLRIGAGVSGHGCEKGCERSADLFGRLALSHGLREANLAVALVLGAHLLDLAAVNEFGRGSVSSSRCNAAYAQVGREGEEMVLQLAVDAAWHEGGQLADLAAVSRITHAISAAGSSICTISSE